MGNTQTLLVMDKFLVRFSYLSLSRISWAPQFDNQEALSEISVPIDPIITKANKTNRVRICATGTRHLGITWTAVFKTQYINLCIFPTYTKI